MSKDNENKQNQQQESSQNNREQQSIQQQQQPQKQQTQQLQQQQTQQTQQQPQYQIPYYIPYGIPPYYGQIPIQPPMQPTMQPTMQPQMYMQMMPQQPISNINYFQPSQMQPQIQQQQQQTQKPGQRKLTPEESARIDVDKIYIDENKQWQLHISNVPSGITDQEIEDTFKCYGEIKDVSTFPQKNYAFVNFKDREGAINAFQNSDQIQIRGEKVKLQSSHNELQIILRRIPQKIDERTQEFIDCLKKFLQEKDKDLFCHIQVEKSNTSVYSAYLHFLTKEESKKAFSYLSNLDFTKYCNEKMHLVNDYENAKYVTNEEVQQRDQRGEKVNQDPEHEICQFMCLRFIKEQTNNKIKQVQQQQQVQQIQQPQEQVVVFKTSVYLTEVPVGYKQEDLLKLMERFGKVREVRIISKKQSETKCNCAVVKFSQQSEAERAINEKRIISDTGEVIYIQQHVKKN